MSSRSDVQDPLDELERFLRAIQQTRALRSGIHLPPVPTPVAPPPILSPRAAATKPRFARWQLVPAAAALLLLGVLLLNHFAHPQVVQLTQAGASTPSATAAAAAARPSQPDAPTARTPDGPDVPAVPTTTAAPAASGVHVEIVTSRAVWLRLIVDGATTFEGEVPAGTRRVDAAQTIVVRVGDAAATRIVAGGVDQGVLGRAGRVVTKAFVTKAPD